MRMDLILLVLAVLGLASCNSVARQKERFIESLDYQIGRPFFSHEKRGMREVKITPTLSEFVPEIVTPEGVFTAWTVDTSQRGPYRFPRIDRVYPIEGIKKSWRLIGDPEKARLKLNWLGPW